MSQTAMRGLKFAGIGSAVPDSYLDNHQLSRIVDTSDEWITTRTGIGRRHLDGHNHSLVSLATQAAQKAMAMADVAPEKVDLILLATSTPDDLFGSAGQIQAKLGASHALAFDITAACSGFTVGILTAAQFIRTGTYKTILLIGADIISRWLDWSDRRTCVLFGDGAGAAILQADSGDCLFDSAFHTDGTLNSCITLKYEAQRRPLVDDLWVSSGTYKPLAMDGQQVYRFVVQKIPQVIEKVLAQANLTVDDIDWLLLHQANQRIMQAVADRLGISSERTITNLAKYGNTSSASIPLALDEAVRRGQVRPHDVIVMVGFGAGLTWGAIVFKWG